MSEEARAPGEVPLVELQVYAAVFDLAAWQESASTHLSGNDVPGIVRSLRQRLPEGMENGPFRLQVTVICRNGADIDSIPWRGEIP